MDSVGWMRRGRELWGRWNVMGLSRGLIGEGGGVEMKGLSLLLMLILWYCQ